MFDIIYNTHYIHLYVIYILYICMRRCVCKRTHIYIYTHVFTHLGIDTQPSTYLYNYFCIQVHHCYTSRDHFDIEKHDTSTLPTLLSLQNIKPIIKISKQSNDPATIFGICQQNDGGSSTAMSLSCQRLDGKSC